jgi:uncharacterized protein YjbI with pentapeptide repeats
MAEKEHLRILTQGVDVWNRWRNENDIRSVDLSEVNCDRLDLAGANFTAANLARSSFREAILTEASLRGADLRKAELREVKLGGATLGGANLNEATLSDANLEMADLRGAELQNANLRGASVIYAEIRGANFRQAQLTRADFSYVNSREADNSDPYLHILGRPPPDFSGSNLYEAILNEALLPAANFLGANLTGAQLYGTNLSRATLRGAIIHRATLVRSDMRNADLRGAVLIDSDLRGADLTGSRVFGVSAWRLNLEGTRQGELVITDDGEALVTVDYLEVAQFIHLLRNREKLRNVIDTITSKAVLILGRFTPPERKVILEAVAGRLRENNLLPIVFDFERSTARDFTETIKVLAGLSLFVIADITNPKSTPLELQATVPDYQIPFVPIIQDGEEPFSMFNDLWLKYKWVLEPVNYPSADTLRLIFETAILDRAWSKHKELQKAKTEAVQVLSWKTFLNKSDA